MAYNKALISVCMPAYNAELYIAEAVRSVIDQTYQNWELIIVNDGSSDQTGNIAESFTDARIKVIHQNNRGQCAAANKAFSFSKGDYIKYFDADDILSPNMLEEQAKKINTNIDCVASAEWGRFHNNDLNTFKLNKESVWRDMPADEWLVEAWMNAQPMMQCALWLIPRDIVIKSGGWDEKLSLINDFDFFTRILVNSKMVLHSTDAILYYRSGIIDSLSRLKSRAGIISAYTSIEKGTTTLLSKRNDHAAQLSCANIWQLFIYDTYPYHLDLISKAKEHLRQLPKPTLPFPSGGATKFLLHFLNWKTIKNIKRIRNFGYSKK